MIEYNETLTSVTWETCTLRKWLNNDFVDSAFTLLEKERISTLNATQDKLFLLSASEADVHFSSNLARQCQATDYAIAKGARKKTPWYLRTPGKTNERAASVTGDGYISVIGAAVSSRAINDVNISANGIAALRPAVLIDLNS